MSYKDKLELRADKTIVLGGDGNPTSIEGHYLGSQTTPDKGYGPGTLHFFALRNNPSEVVAVWGKSRLNSILQGEVGRMVLVTFTGMSDPKKGKRPAYTYKLKYDENNTVDTTGMRVSFSEQEPNYEDASDTDLDSEEQSLDAVQLARPTAPISPASVPSAERIAAVRATLAARKVSKTA